MCLHDFWVSFWIFGLLTLFNVQVFCWVGSPTSKKSIKEGQYVSTATRNGRPTREWYFLRSFMKVSDFGDILVFGVFLLEFTILCHSSNQKFTKKSWLHFKNLYLLSYFLGNRTWVLLDFDRYILDFWRPNGVHVIFGDSYVDKKQRAGFHLCDYCGMLEQTPQQFPTYSGKK